jgi:hypothetical protein
MLARGSLRSSPLTVKLMLYTIMGCWGRGSCPYCPRIEEGTSQSKFNFEKTISCSEEGAAPQRGARGIMLQKWEQFSLIPQTGEAKPPCPPQRVLRLLKTAMASHVKTYTWSGHRPDCNSLEGFGLRALPCSTSGSRGSPRNLHCLHHETHQAISDTLQS